MNKDLPSEYRYFYPWEVSMIDSWNEVLAEAEEVRDRIAEYSDADVCDVMDGLSDMARDMDAQGFDGREARDLISDLDDLLTERSR